MQNLYFFDQKNYYITNIRKLLTTLILHHLQGSDPEDLKLAEVFNQLLTQSKLSQFDLKKLMTLEHELLNAYQEINHV